MKPTTEKSVHTKTKLRNLFGGISYGPAKIDSLTVERVVLTSPHSSEDVVKLDSNRRAREEAAEEQVTGQGRVTRCTGNLTRHVLRATRGVKRPDQVLAKDGSDDGQRVAH
jgi:hypothetical protein